MTPALDLGRWLVWCAAGLVSGLIGDFTSHHWVNLALGLLVSDLSCWCGDSAMTSAGLSNASVTDSSLLDIGRGMDRKLSILTWSLPLRQLRAFLL